MAITLVVAYVLVLLYLTVATLYPGTGFVRPYGPTERPVQATVEECRQVGPVSDQGLGYWWVCRFAVRHDDGRVTEAVLGGSVASPQDVGMTTELSEACAGPGASRCYYGKPVALHWSLSYGLFRILGNAVGFFLLVVALVYLFRVVVGVPTYFALIDRWRGGKESQ